MKKTTPEILTWLSSSQKRIFSGDLPTESIKGLSCLQNEPISFCLGYRSNYQRAEDEKTPDLPISVRVICDGADAAVYQIGYVPFSAKDCEDGIDSDGVCPDVLLKRSSNPEILPGDAHLPYYEPGEKHLLNVSCVKTGGVLITLNEDRKLLAAGDRNVKIDVISLKNGELIRTHELTLHVVAASLPENPLFYTNWFHYDCLADLYHLPLYSDAYFEVLKAHVKNAVKNGMTALLTPAFTPALDVPVGMERKNVQLVSVTRENGTYRFDFSLLERFIRLALSCGIRYIEHCHLFSQWGATSAINIYGTENGEYKRLFSWDDPADGDAYAGFLRAYLTEFLSFAKKLGISDRLLFHISDEPSAEHAPAYSRAWSIVKELLAEYSVGDALSNYSLYEAGLVKMPIVSTHNADDFFGRCENFMLYYTGGHLDEGLSNRILTSSPQKTRMLGLQLYKYRAKGFLHWGYNYYYGRMCHGIFDPMCDPCGYRNMPAVSYLVYPLFDRSVAPSIREIQMRDAMSDYAALLRLESLIGYDATVRFCTDFFGEEITVFTCPDSGEQMLAFREALNREIEKYS